MPEREIGNMASETMDATQYTRQSSVSDSCGSFVDAKVVLHWMPSQAGQISMMLYKTEIRQAITHSLFTHFEATCQLRH